MNRYRIVRVLGDGSFGTVVEAQSKQTEERVAIKTMKQEFHDWSECTALREVKSLRKLNHPNVVKLKEIIRENGKLNLIFEYCDCSLYALLKGGNPLPLATVRRLAKHLFQGLSYLHDNGFFHRDIKPDNLLLSQETLKIADFGLAREMRSRPPYSEYVSTRWYRAPELLFRASCYGSPVDLWAAGCVLAEMLTGRPLFPGSSEADQIYRICGVLGQPAAWEDGLKLAARLNFRLPSLEPTPLETLLQRCPPEALRLVEATVLYDPHRRLTASQCLLHPFFLAEEAAFTGPENEEAAARPRAGGAPTAAHRPASEKRSPPPPLDAELDRILSEMFPAATAKH